MNRHERRAAKKRKLKVGDAINIQYRTMCEEHPAYGEQAECFVCDAPHRVCRLAAVEDAEKIAFFPLCEPCYEKGDPDAVMREYWNAPDDLVIKESSEATIQAIWEKLRNSATEH